MPGNIINRTVSAAVTPLIRKLAPLVATAATTTLNLIVLAIIAGLLLIGVHIASNHQVPDWLLKTAAVAAVTIPCTYALLVVIEQIRLTYRQDRDLIYPTVEVFPDREPT